MIIHNPIRYSHNHITTFFLPPPNRPYAIFEAEIGNKARRFMMRSQWMEQSRHDDVPIFPTSPRR